MMDMQTFKQAPLYEKIKSLFLNGLLTILPLAVTIAVLSFVLHTLQRWLAPIYNIMPSFLKNIPGSEFIIAVTTILTIGVILQFFIMRPLLDSVEKIFEKIPLFRAIYFGVKKLLNAFSPKDKLHFQQVVLVEFPRSGIYSVGFLTSQHASGLAAQELKATETYYNVFVPHTPNPTTGFFLVVPATDCHMTSLTRQEAMTMVISGGIIQPERFIQEQK